VVDTNIKVVPGEKRRILFVYFLVSVWRLVKNVEEYSNFWNS